MSPKGAEESPLRALGVPAAAVPAIATVLATVGSMAIWPFLVKTLTGLLKGFVAAFIKNRAKKGKKVDASARSFVIAGFRLRPAELGALLKLRAGDRVSVIGYGAGTRVAQGFTPELDVVNDAIVLKILAGSFAGNGRVEMAAEEAAGRFRSEPVSHRKRAILAISDKGEPAGGEVRGLWDGNIVFSELLVGKGGATRVLESTAGSLVSRTGGVVIAAGVPGEAFQQSVHYLRSGYTLFYSLPAGASGSSRNVL